ncbi:hypothetical protein L208DRAFT_1127562, partial [Tricholoma matsutake]
PSITQSQFRNVSITTAHNAKKDEINQLGSNRFAAETMQWLTHFVSHDTIAHDEPNDIDYKRHLKAPYKATKKRKDLPPLVQQALWAQPPCANTKLIPGCLSCCIDMPILIRANSATELCITKGQEAVVHSWDYSETANRNKILDTLLVRLIHPPTAVQLDGLPPNVVPLIKTTVTTCCRLPDDSNIMV